MSDRVQIGPKVDAELWAEFREDVEDRKGQTRGVLGNELENAIRNYLYYGEDRTLTEQFAEFNQRLERVEGAVGAAEADGGAVSEDVHTHTERTKPGEKATRSKKVAYLIDQKYDREGGSVTPDTIKADVKDVYGFGDRTAPKYVQPVIDALDAKWHPNNPDLLVWGEMERRVKENIENDINNTDT